MAGDTVDRLKLNQNLWALVISYAALGAAEYWELNRLRCLALIMAVVLSILVLASMAFYTINYCVGKWFDARKEMRGGTGRT
jgi:hypothetical protein